MNYLGNLLQTRRFPSTQSGLLQGNTFRGQPMGVSPIRGMAAQQAALPLTSGSMYQGPTSSPSIGQRVSSGLGGVARGIGDAFTGEGSSARLSALGASLLQGPSRTPISLGSSLAQGLLAGNIAAQEEQERKFKRGLLEREMAVAEGKLSAEERKLKAGSLKDLFIGTDKSGNIVGQFSQGSPEYFEAVSDPNITLYKTPVMPKGEMVSGTVEDFKTVYIDNKPVTAEKYKDKFGNISYRDIKTKSPLSNFSLVKPESEKSEVKTEAPFSVVLTKPFGGKNAGDEVTIQSVTIDGKEDLYMTDLEGERTKIATDAFTKDFVSKADILKIGVGQIEKLDSKIAEEQSALAGLDRFGALAEQAEDMGLKGVSFVTEKIKAAFNSFSGQDLTERQKVVQFLRAEQQSTLGRIRVEVLGPGVLTENDAKRLIAAMGTNIEGWFANPTLLKQTIQNIREEKIALILGKQQRRDSWARGEVPKASKRLFMPNTWAENGGTYAGWNALTEEQKRNAIELGKEGK